MRNYLVGIVLILIIGIAPLITLWSLNTLFSLGITYSVSSWAATVWLNLITFGAVARQLLSIKQEVVKLNENI